MSSQKSSDRYDERQNRGGGKLLLVASLLTLGAVGVGTYYFYFLASNSDESTSMQTFTLLQNARNLANYAASRFSRTTTPPVENVVKPDEEPQVEDPTVVNS